MSKDPTPLSAYFELYRLALYYEGKSPRNPRHPLLQPRPVGEESGETARTSGVLSDFTPDNAVEYVSVRKLEPRLVGHQDHRVGKGTLSLPTIDQGVGTLRASPPGCARSAIPGPTC